MGGNQAPMQDAVTINAGGTSAATQGGERLRLIARNILPFAVVGGIWEIVAWAGVFPRRLFPTLEEVAASFVNLTISGILPHHAVETIFRLLTGFALAAVLGVTVGVLMGRALRVAACFLPVVAAGRHIHGL